MQFGDQLVKNNPYPKYLGVVLDRTLTFKNHLVKLSAKIKTRNSIIAELSSTSWGADANTLRIRALALVYSAAEYCAPVWINSAHTNKLDTQLNSAMRIIRGTLKTTPLKWLPVLSNKAFPKIRREQALIREWTKIKNNKNLPVHADVRLNADRLRLKSRKPLWKTAEMLLLENTGENTKWLEDWMVENPDGQNIVTNPTFKQPGFDLPRKIWVRLGRCNHMMYKWKLHTTPSCDCGNDMQTISHIAIECPFRAF